MSGKPGQLPTKPTAIPADMPVGADVLDQIDGRSVPARSLKQRLEAIRAEIAPSGGSLSPAQNSLALRVANLETVLAAREAKLISGELKDDDDFLKGYLQGCSMLLQLRRALGLANPEDRNGRGDSEMKAALKTLTERQLHALAAILSESGDGGSNDI